MIEQKTSKNKQLEYYKDWVEMQKGKILEILEDIPTLKKEFNLDEDVIFRIMCHYGMGASKICEFIGKNVLWKHEEIS